MEVLRPIPIARLRIDAEPIRTGRRVQYAQAIVTADDVEVARASAWRIRTNDEPMPATPIEAPPFDGPLESKELPPVPVEAPESYFGAMEWRYARGTFTEPGPATVWMRMRKPLVEGEPIAPLSRVLAAADSGNGISAVLDFQSHLFINTDLTVHLFRMPEGEWVCIDAETRQDATGIGVTQSIVWDEQHRIGAGAQSLLISPR
jgi:Thioesterase-like superfamily